MTDDLAELRVDVCFAHGLDERAAAFITGTTIGEMEASARGLAELFAHRPEPDTIADVITRSLSEKEERKRALVQALHGPRRQERDEHGRFTGGFDGGAHGSAPRTRDPELAHNKLVAELSGFAKIGRSDF